MTTSQLLAMLNKQLTKEQLKNIELATRLEEVESQYAYECECNKQFVETQKKCERLEILIVNALTLLEEQGFGGKSFAVAELGMTEQEYKNIMGEQK